MKPESVLVRLGRSWFVLGPSWSVLVRLGPSWSVLVRLGPSWSVLVRLGERSRTKTRRKQPVRKLYSRSKAAAPINPASAPASDLTIAIGS